MKHICPESNFKVLWFCYVLQLGMRAQLLVSVDALGSAECEALSRRLKWTHAKSEASSWPSSDKKKNSGSFRGIQPSVSHYLFSTSGRDRRLDQLPCSLVLRQHILLDVHARTHQSRGWWRGHGTPLENLPEHVSFPAPESIWTAPRGTIGRGLQMVRIGRKQ